jgi:hypothetical protein
MLTYIYSGVSDYLVSGSQPIKKIPYGGGAVLRPLDLTPY